MQRDQDTKWLKSNNWADWTRHPITGDASARSYERLVHPDGRTAILMKAPKEPSGSQSAFVALARHLRQSGAAAPEVYAWNDSLGLMVLEDLGAVDFAKHLVARPEDERALYSAAVEILCHVQQARPPRGLKTLTPDIGVEMVSLTFDWAAPDINPDTRQAIKTELHRLLETVDQTEKALCLRDFHAENLIWRPEKQGRAWIGLLDFQDAILAHPAYDLASLMRDARRDVDPELTDPMIAEFAQRRKMAENDVRRAFHTLAVQRNLRIIGIFERLDKRDGKAGYRKLLPRVFGHLRADLSSPVMEKLQPMIKSAFPMIWQGIP